MPTEKHQKKNNNESTNDQHENNHEQPKSQLFNEADLKSVETSGYISDPRTFQANQQITERVMPTGVVDIDKNMQLPKSSTKSSQQQRNSKQYLQPIDNQYKEDIHLPPINDHSRHHHHPYDSQYFQPNYYNNLVGYNYEPSSHHHPHSHRHHRHHHHSHKHHHHRHHRHHHHHHDEQEVETYDSRWWYLPHNKVHAPKAWQPPEYHYVAPKWYESASKENGTTPIPSSRKSPAQKYPDCRCEVCKPSKVTPRGIRWVVNT